MINIDTTIAKHLLHHRYDQRLFRSILVWGLFVTFSCLQVYAEDTRELVFLNWSDYLDPEVIADFEKQYNAKVSEVYFESDDIRTDLLLETNGRGYDLVLSAGFDLEKYKKQGWLASVTSKDVPNLKYIAPRWLEAFSESKGYAVPYFWGTMGIAYRKDLIDYSIESWTQLFHPEEVLSGKILMASSVNDVIGMALKALGYPPDSTNLEHYKKVEQLLIEQKPHVAEYGYLSLTEKSLLVTGDVYAAMTYSGDALVIKDYEPNIEYVIPKEGGNIWVDYIAVLSASNNKKLAYQFINYLNKPKIAARLAEYVYYASPNTAAEKFLSEEYLSNSIIYPDKQALSRSNYNDRLPVSIQRKRSNIVNALLQR